MTLLTACGDPLLGTRLMLSDLDAFMGQGSPYRKLRVMPHLDHAFPWLDGDVMRVFADRFASIMCDASERPFDENIRLTADYVEQARGRVVVEGAVDEIYEAGSGGHRNELTTVEQAQRFLSKTGVDIIVPNVGTEHRATAGVAAYMGDRARQIGAAVGKIMCLHGASSLRSEDLAGLPADGFVKVNVYTTLAVRGGQAVARHVITNVGRILGRAELQDLTARRVLGEAALSPGHGIGGSPPKPELNYLANPLRRDAWFQAVKNACREIMQVLGYHKYAA
jgi:fructose-bisphosphate aldolase class II